MKKIFSIFPVLFLDFLTYSAIIAFFPHFFLKTHYGFFSEDTSLTVRYTLLGILSSIYPLAQLFGAPLIGHLADQMGKKGALIICYLGNIIGYSLCALGVITQTVIPFFLGNFISGLTGVNLSITNAIIASSSIRSARAKLFALSHLMIGLGYILGPQLSSLFMHHLGSLLPAAKALFFVCMACSFLNSIFIYTCWSQEDTAAPQPQVHPFHFRYFFSCSKKLKVLFGAELFLFLGWFLFIKTFQVFLIQVCSCSEREIFNIYSQYGLWFTLSQIGFMGTGHIYYEQGKFFLLMIFILSGALLSLASIQGYNEVCYILPFITIGYALLMPSLSYRISKESGDQELGKVMGLHQSVQSLAKMVGPLLSGLCLMWTPVTTVIFPALFVFVSGIVFILTHQKKSEESSLKEV
ncbi:MFS transporter [Rhabdochlamydiaceae symbiont of Dictyostelium giganteum]|uniref:MFS transporter n=1 Tax=Rhabdochlamydiaceae symbiont of Dictyostelium giganteum TaxID=3342349 RepID=UPI00384EF637